MVVVAVDVVGPVPYEGSRAFGTAGPAELRRLRVEHAVDPAHPANAAIVDLELAPRDADGLVHFEHDVVVVQPADPARRNRWALVDAVNRGRPTIPAYLLGDDSPPFPTPPAPRAGDGSLLAAGWTLVSCGWQLDVEGPPELGLRAPLLAGDVRGRVGYTIRPCAPANRLPLSSPGHWTWPVALDAAPVLLEDGVPLAAGSWSLAPDGLTMRRRDGFTPGCTYRCEYEATGARVSGCGLLALRDLARWLRSVDADDPGGIGPVQHTALFGISQSGRLLRQFLHDGMNADEAGAPAYDAVLPVIAGGRRGQFNTRFAVPGALPDEGAVGAMDDDATYGCLLAASDAAGVTPKVIALNTSTEYWRGDAAALLPEVHPAVRVHHVAGTQHSPGIVPQVFEVPAVRWRGVHGFGTVDYRPVLRALLLQLVQWVEHGVEPTPGQAPGPDQLGTRDEVLAGFTTRGHATPDASSFMPPAGPVPLVDDAGNELGGIRLPDVAVPLGVHTGWNARHPAAGAPTDEMFLMGSTWWWPAAAAGPSATLAGHLAACRTVIDGLVAQGLLLGSDVDLVLGHAEARWHESRRGAVPPA